MHKLKTKKPVAVAAVVNSASLSRRERKRIKYASGELLPLVPKEVFQKAFSRSLCTRRAKLKRLLTADELRALATSIRRGYHQKKTRGICPKAGVGYIPTLKTSRVRAVKQPKMDSKISAPVKRNLTSKRTLASKPVVFVSGGQHQPPKLESNWGSVTPQSAIASDANNSCDVDNHQTSTGETKPEVDDKSAVKATISAGIRAMEVAKATADKAEIFKIKSNILKLCQQAQAQSAKAFSLAPDVCALVEQLKSTYNVDVDKFFLPVIDKGEDAFGVCTSKIFDGAKSVVIYVDAKDLQTAHESFLTRQAHLAKRKAKRFF